MPTGDNIFRWVEKSGGVALVESDSGQVVQTKDVGFVNEFAESLRFEYLFSLWPIDKSRGHSGHAMYEAMERIGIEGVPTRKPSNF